MYIEFFYNRCLFRWNIEKRLSSCQRTKRYNRNYLNLPWWCLSTEFDILIRKKYSINLKEISLINPSQNISYLNLILFLFTFGWICTDRFLFLHDFLHFFEQIFQNSLLHRHLLHLVWIIEIHFSSFNGRQFTKKFKEKHKKQDNAYRNCRSKRKPNRSTGFKTSRKKLKRTSNKDFHRNHIEKQKYKWN